MRDGLPKYGNSKKKEWTKDNVKSFIRNTIYKGGETGRKTLGAKLYEKGKRIRVPNPVPPTRPMECLRFVSDLLWQQANEAITGRDKTENHPTGEDNPTLNNEIDTLGEKAIKFPDNETYDQKLTEREQHRRTLRCELQALEDQIAAAARPVSREEILATAKEAAGNLADIDGEAREVLRQLTTQIMAVPFQRIDCPLIVLRARFRVNLVALLPAEWQQLIREADVDLGEAGLLSRQIEVDLYDEPKPVQIAREALAAHWEGLRITDTVARGGSAPRGRPCTRPSAWAS